MKEWLSKLHEYFLDKQPFVLVTVSAYHGSSPESPDVALLLSANKSHRFISSEHRYLAMVKTATNMLDHPASYHTEELQLGRIAGTDNRHCEVFYEYFDTAHYPDWLTQLREHSFSGISGTLVREFDKNNSNNVLSTEVLQGTAVKTSLKSKHFESKDCFVQETENSILLLRTIRSDIIAVSIVGDHPVADEIQNQSAHLPIEITRLNSASDPLPDNRIVIIMTTDHELDYQHCESSLKLLTGQDAFVGCIGSKRKADIFTQRLLQSGVSESQLQQLYMPVGLAEISGKQNAVVAASIIAQLLTQHRW